MLTLFTTAKPFRGHFGVIQRNALKSWKLLHPDVEVILFGDEEGYGEAARDLGLRHEAEVAKNEFGTVLVGSMFGKAQAMAKHRLLCYVNCDILLLSDFCAALRTVREKQERFLMVGRRWDTEIAEPLAFEQAGWEQEVREGALRAGRRRTADWIDYFAFSRGTYGDIPDFAIGRTCWDNWLVWNVAASGYPVIDASSAVVAVHQNHDYSHHPGGKTGVWSGEEMARNLVLSGGVNHHFTIAHAPYRLTEKGVERRRFYKVARAWWTTKRRVLLAARHGVIAWQNAVWHPVLNATRPMRSALGLRKAGAPPVRKP